MTFVNTNFQIVCRGNPLWLPCVSTWSFRVLVRSIRKGGHRGPPLHAFQHLKSLYGRFVNRPLIQPSQ